MLILIQNYNSKINVLNTIKQILKRLLKRLLKQLQNILF